MFFQLQCGCESTLKVQLDPNAPYRSRRRVRGVMTNDGTNLQKLKFVKIRILQIMLGFKLLGNRLPWRQPKGAT